MINEDFNSILEIIKAFPDEQSCIDHLESLRWGGNVVSPFDPSSKVYNCAGNKYKCYNTGKYFNVKTNTLFEGSKIKLQKWFVAIWLVTSHKKGISSVQLGKDVGVTQKTAWFMLHRIRQCYGIENDGELGGGGGVEMDETYIGGKSKSKTVRQRVKLRKEREAGKTIKNDKATVFGMVERGGRAIARHVKDASANSIHPIVIKHIPHEGTFIYTDEFNMYKRLGERYEHYQVRHGIHEYVRDHAHTNTIEGFWSILKRGIYGVYHFVSDKHLQRYLDEFTFRYNTRQLTEAQRINVLLANTQRRLTYKALISENADKYS